LGRGPRGGAAAPLPCAARVRARDALALVALGDRVARAGAQHGGAGGPRIAQDVVALRAGDDGGEGLAFLGGAADGRADARRGVDDAAGRGARGGAAAAVVGDVGDRERDALALVA